MKNNIYPCLWFNGNAKEAADFYASVFRQTRITSDTPLVVVFESAGQKFMCLNGGPQFTFNPSISFFVVCETEEEINDTWSKLQESGAALMPLDKYAWSERYGWIQDKFGISWQLILGKIEEYGQKFVPAMMFTGDQQGRAEEAAKFYTSVFDNSSISTLERYTKEDHDIEGTIKHARVSLDDQTFVVMDSSFAHGFSFNEAVSFVVDCKTQSEIDYFWSKLSEGGSEGQCGWLKDQFGVSWQIVPAHLDKVMNDPQKRDKAMQALLKMKKLDMEVLMNS